MAPPPPANNTRQVSKVVGVLVAGAALMALITHQTSRRIDSFESLRASRIGAFEELHSMVEEIYHMTEERAIASMARFRLRNSSQGSTFRDTGVVVQHNAFLWDFYGPFYNCLTKQHVGMFGDTHKWVCGLRTFVYDKEDKCVVYSIGNTNKVMSFEQQLLLTTPCQVHFFDPEISIQEMQSFDKDLPGLIVHQWGLGREDGTFPSPDGDMQWDLKTLGSMMQTLDTEWIDILRVDVEESEWGLLPVLLSEFDILPFTQLIIQLHATKAAASHDYIAPLKFLDGMRAKGFRVFSVEPNLYAYSKHREDTLHVVDYSFLQVDQGGQVVTGPGEGDRALF